MSALLFSMEYITGESPLCGTQGTQLSAWWPRWKGNPEGEGGMRVHVADSATVQQQLTQHCEANSYSNKLKKNPTSPLLTPLPCPAILLTAGVVFHSSSP